MAGKNNQEKAPEPSDIGTIRNILMGAQMAEYQAEFAGIRQKMTEDQAQLNEKLDDLSKASNERFEKLEKEMSDRFERLERMLSDHVARLDQKLLEISKADKQDLGQMLAEISKKLTS